MKTNTNSASTSAKINAQLNKRAAQYAAKLSNMEGISGVAVEEAHSGTAHIFTGNGKVSKKDYKIAYVNFMCNGMKCYVAISDSKGNGMMPGMDEEFVCIESADGIYRGYQNCNMRTNFVKKCLEFKPTK